MNEIQEFTKKSVMKYKNSLYVCAAGFEDRTRGIAETLDGANEKIFRYCKVMEYRSHPDVQQSQKSLFLEKNKENWHFLKAKLMTLANLTENVVVDIDNMLLTRRNVAIALKNIPGSEIDSIFVDISGMANFLVLLTLNQVRALFCDKEVFVLYSEAQNYSPEYQEATDIIQIAQSRNEKDIIRLGELLGASGARETFILPDFKGYFREDLPTCLIFFVGYEPSRAIGLLEGYRPNLVVACYGVSPHEHFKWRTQFSRDLHNGLNVFKQYNSSSTEVSTFNIPEIASKLEEIYISADSTGKLLYENYNIAVTPQCSKLQTVATYQFCQSHPDTQVVFCLPGTFNPERYSKGIGKKWIYKIPF
jgi:hypothetical protein